VALDLRHGRIHVVIDRGCLPVVPGDSGLHANVKHLQATVYDRLGTVVAGSRPTRATWDFLGGQHAMVKVPF
jgi:hypothetical protein